MFGNMMEKLQQMQQKMEESKQRLNNIVVTAESGAGAVVVEMSGNREMKKVSINSELLHSDSKEELEDFIIIAVNRALQDAEKVCEAEMKNSAAGMLPGLGM